MLSISIAWPPAIPREPLATQKLQMLHILALASGSRGMAGGQAIDIDSIGIPLTRAELEHMHLQKTGALIRAAALLGAYSADKPKDDKLNKSKISKLYNKGLEESKNNIVVFMHDDIDIETPNVAHILNQLFIQLLLEVNCQVNYFLNYCMMWLS